MEIKIITDSASDLPKNIAKELNIKVIPLSVFLEEQEFLDGETLLPKKLFDDMRKGLHYKTSQVTLNAFVAGFTEYAKQNIPCIYIAFSSELSGTYNAALTAKKEVLNEYPEFDLEIIDSKCASMGLGLVVYKAAKMALEGNSKEEIIDSIKFNAVHMEHIFTVDDLEYLYRGGRVSRAAAFVGGLLNIKPILHVEEGKLIPIEKIRGRNKLIKRIIEIMKDRGVDLQNQTIAVCHGDDEERLNDLVELIKQESGCEKIITGYVGCAIGAHTGPGLLTLFFLNERENEV